MAKGDFYIFGRSTHADFNITKSDVKVTTNICNGSPVRSARDSHPLSVFTPDIGSSDRPTGQCLSGTRRSQAWAHFSTNKRSKRYAKLIACRRRCRLSATPSPSIQPCDQTPADYLAQGRARGRCVLAETPYDVVRKLDRKRDLWIHEGKWRFEPARPAEIAISLPDGNGAGRCEFLHRRGKSD